MKPSLPNLSNADVTGKAVLVRGDFDVDDGDNPRANSIREIVRLLKSKGAAAIRVIGHSETQYDLAAQLKTEFPEVGFDAGLRNDPREKQNDMGYAEELADRWEMFVNESFAVSHRKHTSLVMLPQVFKRDNKPVYVGPRFEKELEMLDKVSTGLASSSKSVLVIGGVKVEDKSEFVIKMADKFEYVLTGGRLPEYLYSNYQTQLANQSLAAKIKIPVLREDRLDISIAAIEEYCRIISQAEMILAAGVMGKYEDPNAAAGTKTGLQAA